jgi:Ca2+-binding EF-hand superfamily protein
MKLERNRNRALAALLAAGALTAFGLEPAAAAPMKQEDITALFRKADANADGGVTKDELSAIEPTLVPNFEKADANKDGKLSLREFGSLFG